MFERLYGTRTASPFFARYEASQLGSLSIETEHLLLGLIRDSKGLIGRIFARAHLSPEKRPPRSRGPHGLPRKGVNVRRDPVQR
jgi:hypothetical protein